MARRTARCFLLLLTVATATAGSTGCASGIGTAIPIEQYTEGPDPGGGEYVIGAGDALNISVFEQATMSARAIVRPDGKITVPLVGEVQAAGKTLAALSTDLEGSLKATIRNPHVTISLEGSKPLTISVLGEVSRPGQQPLDRDTGVAQALAAAGGLTNFAKKNRIFVVRTSPKPVRIHFTYEALTQKVGAASTFRLKAGDVVVVE